MLIYAYVCNTRPRKKYQCFLSPSPPYFLPTLDFSLPIDPNVLREGDRKSRIILPGITHILHECVRLHAYYMNVLDYMHIT